MAKKKKFDLTALVSQGYLKNGQTLYFVSDPAKVCVVQKQPNNEYKVQFGKDVTTIHAFAQACLGQEPPEHASKWVRTEAGKTLYEYWHAEEEYADAA